MNDLAPKVNCFHRHLQNPCSFEILFKSQIFSIKGKNWWELSLYFLLSKSKWRQGNKAYISFCKNFLHAYYLCIFLYLTVFLLFQLLMLPPVCHLYYMNKAYLLLQIYFYFACVKMTQNRNFPFPSPNKESEFHLYWRSKS